jgi:Zn-dependent protease with chaperone function
VSALICGLFVYVAASGALGPRLVREYQCWQRSSPWFGLVLWTTLATSWVVALLSAGLAALDEFSGGKGLPALFRACLRAAVALVSPQHLANVPAAVALVGSVLLVLRLFGTGVRHTHRTRQQRAAHRRTVCAHAPTRYRDGQQLTVVDAADMTAYCVPGRHATVVLTTGVLETLPDRELDAVIAHERAHLRGRHDLVLSWVTVLARAFPFVPLLRAVPEEVARLIEWRADDCAGRGHGRRTVAQALTAMATGTPATAPRGALAATGPEVVERVERLLHSRPSSRRTCGPFLAAVALPVLALTTAGAALVPAATGSGHECPPATSQVR